MNNRKNRKLFITGYCLTPHQRIGNGAILTQGEKILAIGGDSGFVREPGLEVIELPDCYATPGFVDSHIHGSGGFDSCAASADGVDINEMCKVLARHGVTSFVPTVISAPPEKILSNLDILTTMLSRPDYPGAEPVGIHIEGPFINRLKHGSQRVEDIRDIDLGLAREIIAAGKGKLKVVTFAPELENAVKFIELLLENHIHPAMGHSIAGEQDILRAVDAGARRCTHLYNGMPPLHQRNASLGAVALTDDRITIEMILDGSYLLHPRMLDLACRAKPKDKLIGISDCVQGADLRDGHYHLGLSEIEVHGGLATTADGTLAGTTLNLAKGWQCLKNYSHLNNNEAAACVTINPALSLDLDDRGLLRPGKRADISFFYQKTNEARLTVSRGRIVFDAEGKYQPPQPQ
ncbi:MAG: N-acetylglucosamine-6-phosphate deacetylase [Victivallales bacterium]|nr:N-acetylglucosamine-6-phosphate deacetylase [Victivallales bacterium]